MTLTQLFWWLGRRSSHNTRGPGRWLSNSSEWRADTHPGWTGAADSNSAGLRAHGPQAQAWCSKLGRERDNVSGGGGWMRRLPMSSRRFTRLSPSAMDVALLSITSRAASSRSARDANSTVLRLNESDCSSPAQPLLWKSQTWEQCEKCDSVHSIKICCNEALC